MKKLSVSILTFVCLFGAGFKSTHDGTSYKGFELSDQLFPQKYSMMSTMDVESADLDGDGKEDLILATEFGPNRIFFQENGQFVVDESRLLPQLKTYKAPYKGEDSEDIAIADFDRDGDPDLFFVSEDTDKHELLLNDGKGKFTLADSQIPKVGDANAVLIFDFNGDKYPDILIGIRGKNEVFINKKGKGFEEQTTTYWPDNKDATQDVILVDIDGDGDHDIVEGIEDGGSNIYINKKGRFTEESGRLPDMKGYECRKVASADVDLDGDMDLFFCHVSWTPGMDPENMLLLNDGKGHFSFSPNPMPQQMGTTLDAIFIDLDGDSKKDLVTTGLGSLDNFNVFQNQSEKDKVKFVQKEELFPEVLYNGGISMIVTHLGKAGKRGIYLGNHRNIDHLLVEGKTSKN